MDKLKMQSANKIDENIDYIANKFPNCITEVVKDGKVEKAIDFDLLKQELSGFAVEGGEERYQFTWADKKKSILLANSPIAKTLRPCREESVDFDTTKNLYIEGDNLDVLKLLQETYMGKVKMIYIDPPYNTGNDFVYEDDFAISTEEYLERSGASDEDGNRLFQNNDSNGRFHTDWLNMIYPRLKLARDLLTDDGVIFISIDDNEVHNLRKVCDEVFGLSNFISQINILSNPRGRQSSRFFAEAGEYILIYTKDANAAKIFGDCQNEDNISTYNKEDNKGKYREMGLRKRGSDSRREDSPTMFFPIYYDKVNNRISLEKNDTYIEIIPRLEGGSEGRWRWSKNKILADIDQLFCREVKRNGQFVYDVFQKDYFDENDRVKHKNFWIEKEINYDRSAEELRALFDDKIFDYAKPLYLLQKLIKIVIEKNDGIILDFFSGSATTAHAVMQLNAEDGGNRKYIMVQLPEETDEKSEAYKAGYKNICEIGKERIRRAGRKIADENRMTAPNLDIGFRVLKVDSSNMKPVFYNPNAVSQDLLSNLEDNIKDDRTPEDLLFQIMLDMGVDLSSPITVETLGRLPDGSQGKKVFTVGATDSDGQGANLICCFDQNITKETVTAIAKAKPLYAVFRDSSFNRDDIMVSFDQIFETFSPTTVRKVI